MTVRIGIVGSRFVANAHARGISQTAGAELVAAASPTPEHIWEFHRRWGVPHVFADYNDCCDGLIDALLSPARTTCTRSAIDAAKAGCSAGRQAAGDDAGTESTVISRRQESGVVLLYGETSASHQIRGGGEGASGRGCVRRRVLRAAAGVSLRATLGLVLGRPAVRRWGADGHGMPLDRVLPVGVWERAERDCVCGRGDVRARREDAR